MPTVTLHLPLPAGFDIPEGEPLRLSTLAGARVAVLDNGWTSMDVIAALLEEELRDRGVSEVRHVKTPHSLPSPADLLDEVAAQVDAAIVGLGN